MKNDIQKLSYALGVNIGLSLKPQGVEEVDVQMLSNGINDVISGSELKMEKEEVHSILKNHFEQLQARMSKKAFEAQAAYFDENGKREGVITLESGLQYLVLKAGTGKKPTLTSEVTTHYHGTTVDGNVFDSSVERGQPASFPVNRVIAGWTEALQLMPIGSKWKLFVPSNLAYGAQGAGDKIPPNTPLIFDVELLEIN
jgi:FKBP-type peptidyl-prolyl cis-trans isomerase FklB